MIVHYIESVPQFMAFCICATLLPLTATPVSPFTPCIYTGRCLRSMPPVCLSRRVSYA